MEHKGNKIKRGMKMSECAFHLVSSTLRQFSFDYQDIKLSFDFKKKVATLQKLQIVGLRFWRSLWTLYLIAIKFCIKGCGYVEQSSTEMQME